MTRRDPFSGAATLLACVLVGWAVAARPGIHGQDRGEEQPLPSRSVVLEIDTPEQALYKIAVPNLRGSAHLGPQGAEVLRNDLRLVSLFDVLDPRSFVADQAAEGLSVRASSWRAVGAQGVVKGEVRRDGREVEMRFYELSRGEVPAIQRVYRGDPGRLRAWMHDFGNRIVELLTGRPAAFGSRITFARRIGRGRKDVYVADFDGHNVRRVSSGRGIAMLPSFGPGGVWYSVLTPRGMFITRTGVQERAIIRGGGLTMGPVSCGGRILFTSTRDGNSEIYSARPDGTDVRRLTRHRAIDVSPACGPGGQVAFVSTRHGSPQIFVMKLDGSGVRRVTYRGRHNQTPAWCPDPAKQLLAFTGRAGGMDIFTLDLKTGEYTRLTQGQGVNKDPAFSPDCRMVAFWSSRGGIFLSNPQGLNQHLVVRGHAETIRWSRR